MEVSYVTPAAETAEPMDAENRPPLPLYPNVPLVEDEDFPNLSPLSVTLQSIDGAQEGIPLPPPVVPQIHRDDIPDLQPNPQNEEEENDLNEDNNRGRARRRAQRCGNCQQEGHNRNTCPERRRGRAPRRQVRDIPMDIQDPHCTGCYRTSTPAFQIPLNPIATVPRGRKYGDKELQQGDLMCPQCLKYFGTANKPAWVTAWPAYFFSLFTKRRFSDTDERREQILALIPQNIRETYDKLVLSTDKALDYFHWNWEMETKIVDVTKAIDRFTQQMTNHDPDYMIANYRNGMEETGFPSIRCPLGCFLHVENVKEDNKVNYKYVQLHHFLARYIEKVARAFDMQEKKTRSFRPDWPKPVKHLDKHVIPSIYLHPELGPSILCCGSHNTTQDYIHVPEHPILGSHSTPNDNHWAPVKVIPNIARQGGTGNKNGDRANTSYPTLTMMGSHSGVSTFYMAPEDKYDLSGFTYDDIKAANLTFNQRPEIHISGLNGINKESVEYIGNLNEWTEEERAKIEECAKSGTTVSKGDILSLIKNSEQKNAHNSMGISNVSYQVHKSDDWGAKPPKLPNFINSNRLKSPLTNSMFCVISLLLSNRPLYYHFIKKSRTTPGASYKKLNKIIEMINVDNESSEHIRHLQMTRTFEGIISSFDEDYPINEQTSARSLTGAILRHLLGNDIFLDVSNLVVLNTSYH